MLEFVLQNKWKILLLILALVLAGLAFYFFAIWQKPDKNSGKNMDQECLSQATKIFNQIQRESNAIDYTFKSHYNKNLQKCFLLLHGVGISGIGNSDKLISATENKEVAGCETFATAPETNFCKYAGSRVMYDLAAFQDFTKPYMETK